MKVLFIATNRLRTPYPVYPIGLDYVTGAIGNHQPSIVDLGPDDDFSRLNEQLETFAPDVVCLSMRNLDNNDVTSTVDFTGFFKAIVTEVRAKSSAPIVLGGSAYSVYPRVLLRELEADYGILGEGERIGLLLDQLEKGGDPGAVEGVVTRESTETIYRPWTGEITRNVCANSESLEYYLKRGGMMNLQTKRGCPLGCVYCSYPVIEGRALRRFPPEEIAATAKQLEAAGAKFIFITDSTFNVDVDFSLAVARAFKQTGLTIPWCAFFTPLKTPDNYYKEMADCGLSHIEFGADSFSDPVLKAYHKPFTVADLQIEHQKAIDSGVAVAHYLLLGGPGETEQTIAESLDTAEKLEKTVIFFFCGIRLYPNTPLYDIAVAEGKDDNVGDKLDPVFYYADGLSSEKIIEIVEKRAAGRLDWVIGAGGEKVDRVIKIMHKHGRTGPVWDYLIDLKPGQMLR